MRRRYRETQPGCSYEPYSSRNFSAAHGNQKGGRVGAEVLDVDDAILDGACDACSKYRGTAEFSKK